MLAEQTRLRHLNMQIQRRLTECLHIAEQFFRRAFTMPALSYSIRGTKAGVAYLQQNTIKLNRTLLLENPTEFVRQVVPHELAHLIVYQVFGRVKPHGKEWRMIMTELFGLPADTCHQFDITTVQGQTVTYRCNCRIHRLSIRRHNNIRQKNAVYFCRKCKNRLMPIEV